MVMNAKLKQQQKRAYPSLLFGIYQPQIYEEIKQMKNKIDIKNNVLKF